MYFGSCVQMKSSSNVEIKCLKKIKSSIGKSIVSTKFMVGNFIHVHLIHNNYSLRLLGLDTWMVKIIIRVSTYLFKRFYSKKLLELKIHWNHSFYCRRETFNADSLHDAVCVTYQMTFSFIHSLQWFINRNWEFWSSPKTIIIIINMSQIVVLRYRMQWCCFCGKDCI